MRTGCRLCDPNVGAARTGTSASSGAAAGVMEIANPEKPRRENSPCTRDRPVTPRPALPGSGSGADRVSDDSRVSDLRFSHVSRMPIVLETRARYPAIQFALPVLRRCCLRRGRWPRVCRPRRARACHAERALVLERRVCRKVARPSAHAVHPAHLELRRCLTGGARAPVWLVRVFVYATERYGHRCTRRRRRHPTPRRVPLKFGELRYEGAHRSISMQ